MDEHGAGRGCAASAAREPASSMPRGAAPQGARSGRLRAAPRAALGAAPAGTACALPGRPAFPSPASARRPSIRQHPRAAPRARRSSAGVRAAGHAGHAGARPATYRHAVPLVRCRPPRGGEGAPGPGRHGKRGNAEAIGGRCGASIGGLGAHPAPLRRQSLKAAAAANRPHAELGSAGAGTREA